MEIILANFRAKPERRVLNGRTCLVVPGTIVVSGRVLNGNQGPGYYPASEVERDPMIWNGMPLVLWHPEADQGYVTARDPEVLNKQGLGTFFSAMTGGKLQGQFWFDEELVKARDSQFELGQNALYPRLINGEPIEVSTGLFPRYDHTPGVTENGERYDWVARDIRADHIAILPDEQGACSVADGCGVNNEGNVGLFKRAVTAIASALGVNERMCWGRPCPGGGGGAVAESPDERGGAAGGSPPKQTAGTVKATPEAVESDANAAISELQAIEKKYGFGEVGKSQSNKANKEMLKELGTVVEKHAAKFRAVEGPKAVKAAAQRALERVGSFVRAHNSTCSNGCDCEACKARDAENATSMPSRALRGKQGGKLKLIWPKGMKRRETENERMCWGRPCGDGGVRESVDEGGGGGSGAKTRTTKGILKEIEDAGGKKGGKELAREEGLSGKAGVSSFRKGEGFSVKKHSVYPQHEVAYTKKPEESHDEATSRVKEIRKSLESKGIKTSDVTAAGQVDPHKFNVHNQETDMKRDDAIKYLTTNCACYKGEKAKVLNQLDDDQLKAALNSARLMIVVNKAKAKGIDAALNAEDDGEGEAAGVDVAALGEFLGIDVNPAADPVGYTNALKAKLKEVMSQLGEAEAPPPEPPADEPVMSAEDDPEKKDEEMTGNRRRIPIAKPVGNRLTTEEQQAIAYARKHQQQARQALLNRLTANARDKKALAAVYAKMSDDQLQVLANQLPAAQPQQDEVTANRGVGGWFGAAGEPRPQGEGVFNSEADDGAEDELAVINAMRGPSIEWGKIHQRKGKAVSA